jgi:hypothetical protein
MAVIGCAFEPAQKTLATKVVRKVGKERAQGS